MRELAGSYIEDAAGNLAPNLGDEAMKQRKDAEEAVAHEEKKKTKGGKDEQK